MDEISINNINDYEGLRKALNQELNASAVHFCRIGYLLKLARDNNMLEGSSYSNVNEFATAEFGLDPSQVSRFIRINDRFSIGGYSEHLKTEYEAYGSAKLSLMLMLPDEINEELSPEMSKTEINVIKAEYEAEQKISDLEVMMEDATDVPDEFIAAVIKELNDEHQEAARYFADTMHLAEKMGIEVNEEDIKEAYTPDGDISYAIRIPGQGRFVVRMKTDGITIMNLRDPSHKSPLSWAEFKNAVLYDMKDREFPEEEKNNNQKSKSEKIGESIQYAQENIDKMPDKKKKRKPERVKPANIKQPEQKKEEIAPVQEENVENDIQNISEEASEPTGEEKIERVEAEELKPKDLTGAQKDTLDMLEIIKGYVVPEDGTRAKWQLAYDAAQNLTRLIRQFTY